MSEITKQPILPPNTLHVLLLRSYLPWKMIATNKKEAFSSHLTVLAARDSPHTDQKHIHQYWKNPSLRSKARNGASFRLFSIVPSALGASSVSVCNGVDSSFWCFLLRCTALEAEIGINHQFMLWRPTERIKKVTLRCVCKLRIVSRV